MSDAVSEHVLSVLDTLQREDERGGIARSVWKQFRLDYAPKPIGDAESATRAKVEAECAQHLDAWRMSCPTYFTKALWRELDAQIVKLGGETRDYWAHCTVKS